MGRALLTFVFVVGPGNVFELLNYDWSCVVLYVFMYYWVSADDSNWCFLLPNAGCNVYSSCNQSFFAHSPWLRVWSVKSCLRRVILANLVDRWRHWPRHWIKPWFVTVWEDLAILYVVQLWPYWCPRNILLCQSLILETSVGDKNIV